MNKISLEPLGNRILVEPIKPTDTTKSGLFIPDMAKEKSDYAIVIALGTGAKDDNGCSILFEVKVGDKILISKYGGTEIKIENKEFKILNADDVLALVK